MNKIVIVIAALHLFAANGFADEAKKHWYFITVQEIAENGEYGYYYGSSPLSPEEMRAALKNRECIMLENLLVQDEDGFYLWSDEDRLVAGCVFINADKISTIMPLSGDPRRFNDRNGTKQKKTERSGDA